MVPTLSGSIVAIILLLIVGPCILNLLVKFVSSLLENFKLQVLIEIKNPYYCSFLDGPLHGQP
jgi:hypothetical protein